MKRSLALAALVVALGTGCNGGKGGSPPRSRSNPRWGSASCSRSWGKRAGRWPATRGSIPTRNRSANKSPLVPEQLKGLERNFPQRPYVRESRRVIGLATVNAADIRRDGSSRGAA